MVEAADQEKRAGFVALIGAPNVGKSTLLNALVGAKISIVTPKVQTTRMRVRGIAIDGAAQLIFVDTPGIFSPRRRLDRAMVGSAWASTQDADVVALLIDAKKGVKDEDEAILGGLAEVRPPKVLVLNKVDLVDKQVLLALTHTLNERLAFAATFMISARNGDGVADLRHWLAAHVPAGPWLYPEDQISDAPMRSLAAEITRSVSALTIGIGAGADCDGQVMVMHDLLGLEPAWKPRFVRRYAEMGKAAGEAFAAYAADVRAGRFPAAQETYD